MSSYRIARRLSTTGGLVDSFVGLQLPDEKPVVVKRLLGTWPDFGDCLLRRLPLLDAPELPRILEVGAAGGSTWVVQELLDGESLRHVMTSLMNASGYLAPNEGLGVVAAVAGLLRRLHAREPALVHGDVCASTIFLTPQGEVRLLDAALASCAGAMPPLGPARAEVNVLAPEQLSGSATPATDVFRLGLVLYELAVGRPLWGTQTPEQTAQQATAWAGLPAEKVRQVPEPWASLLRAMLAPDPAQRPAAKALAAAMEQAVGQAGWTTSREDLSRLVARACPQRVPLPTGLAEGTRPLTLTPLETASAPAPVAPQVTPPPPSASLTPPGAVVARIATRKISREAFEAIRPDVVEGKPLIETTAPPGPRDARLGELLVERNVLSRERLAEASARAAATGQSLCDTLMGMDDVDEDAVLTVGSELQRIPAMTSRKLDEMAPPPEAVQLVPASLARELRLVPLALKGGTQLMVAMRNPLDTGAHERLKAALGNRSVVAVRVGPRALRRALTRIYGPEDFTTWGPGGWSAPSDGGLAFADEAPPRPAAPSRPDPAPSSSPELSTTTLRRLLVQLLGTHGHRGAMAQQLVALTVAVAARLGASPMELRRVEAASLSAVVLNLAQGRPCYTAIAPEELHVGLGADAPELGPIAAALLDWPATRPPDLAARALCLAFGFAGHGGEPRPSGARLEGALTSFGVGYRVAPADLEALRAALGRP